MHPVIHRHATLACAILLVGCANGPPPTRAAVPPAEVGLAPDHQRPPSPVPRPSPSVMAAPSPLPSASPSTSGWRDGDVIAFEAPQRPGSGNRDIFLYQARWDTVLAVVAANSPADESSPKLSRDRKWLAFQRTTTGADRSAHADLLLLDTVAQRLHTLPALNSATLDETDPDLSGDGRWLAYVASGAGGSRLRLFDLKTHRHHELAGAHRGFSQVSHPRLFDKNRRIAFSARPPAADDRDIYIYDLDSGGLWRPPFVNSPFDEDNPDVSADGTRMLFDSDRFGSRDLFEAHLATGITDGLVFANSPALDERSPRYFGQDGEWIRYKLNPAPSADPGGFLLRVYHPASAVVDTLPVPNRLLGPPIPGL